MCLAEIIIRLVQKLCPLRARPSRLALGLTLRTRKRGCHAPPHVLHLKTQVGILGYRGCREDKDTRGYPGRYLVSQGTAGILRIPYPQDTLGIPGHRWYRILRVLGASQGTAYPPDNDGILGIPRIPTVSSETDIRRIPRYPGVRYPQDTPHIPGCPLAFSDVIMRPMRRGTTRTA